MRAPAAGAVGAQGSACCGCIRPSRRGGFPDAAPRSGGAGRGDALPDEIDACAHGSHNSGSNARKESAPAAKRRVTATPSIVHVGGVTIFRIPATSGRLRQPRTRRTGGR
jgi:hypothetical protein